jgi:hypothetical protein
MRKVSAPPHMPAQHNFSFPFPSTSVHKEEEDAQMALVLESRYKAKISYCSVTCLLRVRFQSVVLISIEAKTRYYISLPFKYARVQAALWHPRSLVLSSLSFLVVVRRGH